MPASRIATAAPAAADHPFATPAAADHSFAAPAAAEHSFATPAAADHPPAAAAESALPAGLLRGLNPEQLAAVTLPARPALILAGAGSGKTRVLTTRIAWLLHTGQVSPGGVLAVTFTNKAAREMLTRLGAMLPYNVRGMWIGTFHGLCNRLLRAHWQLAGLPQTFQILDTQDSLAAVKRVIKAMQLDEDRYPPKQVSWFIAGCKEDGQRPHEVMARDEHTRRMVQIYQAYEDQCQREGVVDFAELLLRSVELLRDHDAVREHYRRRFRHVLVDEFQDTNRLQYRWLQLFAPPPVRRTGGGAGGHGAAEDSGDGATHPGDAVAEPAQGVFVVGDDDQSIYAFRGARVGNMADFEREYRVGEVVKLERNYRSAGHILDAANELIAHNERRLGKTLRTEAGQGEPVRVFEAVSDLAEAQWLLEEAQALHRAGMPRAAIAVLYRSNAQSRVIEGALFNAGVPYRVYGGLRFFERAEVKHALAYLRLIENPNDDTSFLRVVNFPARGIGARTVEQLQDAARASGRSLHQSVGSVAGKAGANLQGFDALIDAMREATRGLTLKQTIEHMLQASGLLDFYRTEREGQDRIENLEELVNAAQAFVTVEGFGRDAVGLLQSGDEPPAAPAGVDADSGEVMSPLAAFLTHAALEAGDNQAQEGQDAIQLMTVHAAKGLEFDAVFITGLEEGLFPHDNAAADADGLEEERRLMYVAITRARQRLYMSFCQTRMLHGQTRYNLRSRFLEELPEAALKWLAPRGGALNTGYRDAWGQAWTRSDAQRSGPAAWAGAGRSTGASPQAAGLMGPLGSSGSTGSVASPASTPPVTSGGVALRTGQGVFHNKFGEGVILALEGRGEDARAQVNFGRHGVKWLALSIAKLTPVD